MKTTTNDARCKGGGGKTHWYPTKNKATPNVQQHMSEVFNRSFLCRSVVEYKKLNRPEKQQQEY